MKLDEDIMFLCGLSSLNVFPENISLICALEYVKAKQGFEDDIM